eukprot:6464536-Prymnesium_polylepis.2
MTDTSTLFSPRARLRNGTVWRPARWGRDRATLAPVWHHTVSGGWWSSGLWSQSGPWFKALADLADTSSKREDVRPMRIEDCASARIIHTPATILPAGVHGTLSP